MPALNRFTWRDWLVFLVLITVVAVMGIPLVAAVKADAQRAESAVRVDDLQTTLVRYRERTSKLPQLVDSWRGLTERKAMAPASVTPPPEQAAYVYTAAD